LSDSDAGPTCIDDAFFDIGAAFSCIDAVLDRIAAPLRCIGGTWSWTRSARIWRDRRIRIHFGAPQRMS